MGLILEAVKKTAVMQVAKFMCLVNTEMDKMDAIDQEESASATSVITDFEKPELLDGQVVARRFRIGFSNVTADGAGG